MQKMPENCLIIFLINIKKTNHFQPLWSSAPQETIGRGRLELYTVFQKRPPFHFLNNSVKN